MLTVEVASLLWGIAAMVLIWVGLERWQHSLARSRMERLGVGFAGVVELPSEMGLRVLVRSLGDGTEARWPQLGQRLRRGVEAAGVVGLPSVEELLGWKVLGLGLGFVAGLLMVAWLGWLALTFLVLFVGVGWLGVDVWLERRAVARRRAIEHALLTVMDLLALSLEAGMGLDRALRVICDRVESPLTQELRRVLAEVDLGIARRDAFEHLAERVPVEDIRMLTIAIIQSEELSASLVEAMRLQTRSLRIRRRQQAEAEAHRAPIKMMFPMVLFVLPALFIVIIAPVALQLARALART